MNKFAKMSSIALALLVCLGAAERCRGDVVYLALGDSLTFGFDPSNPASLTPSFADQGFVRPVADYMTNFNGGVRPTVRNLGVAGELSTSFFSAIAPPGWPNRVPQLNLNYPNTTTPQHDLMVSSIGAIHAAGGRVGFVSLLFGSNDILYLVNTPAFQSATPAAQQAMLASTINTVLTNYQTVLPEVRTLAPEATLLMPGYYNPFPSFAPEHALYDSILQVFNPAVRSLAQGFGGRYVDLYPVIAGRELLLTNIATGDVHPNQAGYTALSGAFVGVVPEPTSILMVATGLIGVVGAWQVRRRATRVSS